MASHLKFVKKSTMTDEMRKTLCEHARDNPFCTQKQLQQWVAEKFNLQVSQATISNTIKKSTDYLSANMERGDTKRHKGAKFPELEAVLYEWFIQYQDRINMSGELIIEKAKVLLKKMFHTDTPEISFSQGSLERFKSRHVIKSYRHFGESGSVNMENLESNLQTIREKLDQFSMKDVFNMDER